MFGFFGMLAMMLAPFIIDSTNGKLLAITGLAMLTVQAINLRAYNLVALNLVGIGGYTYAIYI